MMPKSPSSPWSGSVAYGVPVTPTVPWEPHMPTPGDGPVFTPPLPPLAPLEAAATLRENAMKVAMWYAACVAMDNAQARLDAPKPCKLSEAIAAVEWVREAMPKVVMISERQVTAMWFSGTVIAPGGKV